MNIICPECDKTTERFRGSYKHPFCEKCWEDKFGKGEEADKKYLEWMNKHHDCFCRDKLNILQALLLFMIFVFLLPCVVIGLLIEKIEDKFAR